MAVTAAIPYTVRNLLRQCNPNMDRIEARNARIRRLWNQGRNMAWIGRRVGISKERVSQILGRPLRYTDSVHPATLAINARIESHVRRLRSLPDVTSINRLAVRCRVHQDRVARHLHEIGMFEEVQAVFRRRRMERRQLRLRTLTRDVGHALGHTPRYFDLKARGISFTMIKEAFGSMRALQVAAGFAPTQRGKIPRPIPPA